MTKKKSLKLKELNYLACVICDICKGYIIDATTITECLHTFCRSCIVKHAYVSYACPTCGVEIHKTRPLLNLRSDVSAQEIIYKLVPGLQAREIERRKKFLQEENEASDTSKERMKCDILDLIPRPKTIAFRLKNLSGAELQLSEDCTNEWQDIKTRYQESYLRTKINITVSVLQKFVRTKAKNKISDEAIIMLIFRDRLLQPEDTLAKLEDFDPDPDGQITLHFIIFEHRSVLKRRADAAALQEAELKSILDVQPAKRAKIVEVANDTNNHKEVKVETAKPQKSGRRKNRPPTKIPMNSYNDPQPVEQIREPPAAYQKPFTPRIPTSSEKLRPVEPIIEKRDNIAKGTLVWPPVVEVHGRSWKAPASTAKSRGATTVFNQRRRDITSNSDLDLNLSSDFPSTSSALSGGQMEHSGSSSSHGKVEPIKIHFKAQKVQSNNNNRERQRSYVIVSPHYNVETGAAELDRNVQDQPTSSSSGISRDQQQQRANCNVLSGLLSKAIASDQQHKLEQQRQLQEAIQANIERTKQKAQQVKLEFYRAKQMETNRTQVQQHNNNQQQQPQQTNRRKQKFIKPTHIRTASYEESPPHDNESRRSLQEEINQVRLLNQKRQQMQQQMQQQEQQQRHSFHLHKVQSAQFQSRNNKRAPQSSNQEFYHLNVPVNEARSRKPPVAVGDMTSKPSTSRDLSGLNRSSMNGISGNTQRLATEQKQHRHNMIQKLNRQIEYRKTSDEEAHALALAVARKAMRESKLVPASSNPVSKPMNSWDVLNKKQPRNRPILPKPISPVYQVISTGQVVHRRSPTPSNVALISSSNDGDNGLTFEQMMQQQLETHRAHLAKMGNVVPAAQSNSNFNSNQGNQSSSASSQLTRNEVKHSVSTAPKVAPLQRSRVIYSDPSTSKRLLASPASPISNGGLSSPNITFEFPLKSSNSKDQGSPRIDSPTAARSGRFMIHQNQRISLDSYKTVATKTLQASSSNPGSSINNSTSQPSTSHRLQKNVAAGSSNNNNNDFYPINDFRMKQQQQNQAIKQQQRSKSNLPTSFVLSSTPSLQRQNQSKNPFVPSSSKLVPATPKGHRHKLPILRNQIRSNLNPRPIRPRPDGMDRNEGRLGNATFYALCNNPKSSPPAPNQDLPIDFSVKKLQPSASSSSSLFNSNWKNSHEENGN